MYQQRHHGGDRYYMRLVGLLILTMIFTGYGRPAFASEDDAALWIALRSGNHFALLRHAIAPGTGDPPQFTLERCDTQRNLSDRGREQARKIGNRFRENGIDNARLLSSQWCRCLETAGLLGLGPVEALPALNSFFDRFERQGSQTRMLEKWLSKQDLDQPLVLVTHQVNITALTGIYPASGELVIVRRSKNGDLAAVGTIKTQ
jgi:broad specificity phosphatase PhoE